MKDDYNTNSHYLTYTFIFRKVGRMYFLNLGMKGLKSRIRLIGLRATGTEYIRCLGKMCVSSSPLYCGRNTMIG